MSHCKCDVTVLLSERSSLALQGFGLFLNLKSSSITAYYNDQQTCARPGCCSWSDQGSRTQSKVREHAVARDGT